MGHLITGCFVPRDVLLIDKKAEHLQLKLKTRNDVFSLFKSSITNVVRTGGVNCRIYISYERPNLIYTLEFDTATMDLEQMNNLRQRTELLHKLENLNATLEFNKHEVNAMFVLTIPVKSEGL